MDSTVEAALTRLAREQGGPVVALLARQFRDLDLADDAVQDALLDATRTWPTRGIPDEPGAWLRRTARNRAIDRWRRADSASRRTLAAAPDLLIDWSTSGADPDLIQDASDVDDEHLRLVLLCCHPALDRDAQVALTLRLVGGLTTTEIASAFLLPTATLAQRIVRAKGKIRDAGIPLTIPSQLDDRIGVVLAVLYLILNEGYLTRGDNGQVLRIDLVDEAVRLTQVLDRLAPGHAEVEGLLALGLFHRARMRARTDPAGDLVLLDDQDRTLWDRLTIEHANVMLGRAMSRMQPGPYQVQALIAGYHANAPTPGETDRLAIIGLYGQLAAMLPSPVIALNHAVAVATVEGPLTGLAMLDRIDGLDRYHLYHAARGELLLRAGDPDGSAAAAFRRALSLTDNVAERRYLEERRSAAASGSQRQPA